MELRGKRPMLARVQRREMARYYHEVQKQKHELGGKLKAVDLYLKGTRLSSRPKITIKPMPRLRSTRLKRYRMRRY